MDDMACPASKLCLFLPIVLGNSWCTHLMMSDHRGREEQLDRDNNERGQFPHITWWAIGRLHHRGQNSREIIISKLNLRGRIKFADNLRKPVVKASYDNLAKFGLYSTLDSPVLHAMWFSMMTSSNGNIFRATGPLCGEFIAPGEFPTQRPVARSFDVFFDLCLNNGWVNNRKAGDLRRYRAH